jgi:hypothetical protein
MAQETLVSFEIRDAGKSVVLDADLPEIEDMPRKITALPKQGYKLTVKELKGKALHELYARHVYGVGFRLLGEVFATLPTVERVTLSAFTQRAAPDTDHQSDTYIYSVRVTPDDWAWINFTNLAAVDVTASFEPFTLRRKIARNGVFEAIEPIEAD